MYEHIICEERGGLGILTLNSEKTLNSLKVPMIAETSKVLKAWKENDNISCVFLQGAGEKAFCAGGDVRRMYDAIVQQQREAPGVVPIACVEFFTQEYRLDYEIHRYPKPIIVWGDGIVMGGGIGLLAGASHRIVTEKSKFAMPEITIGLYPDVGGTWFLNRMPDGFGLYLGMTGTRLKAEDCLYLGLADHFIKSNLKGELLNRLASADWQRSNQNNMELVTNIVTAIGVNGKPAGSTAEAHAELISGFKNVASVAEFRERLLSARNQDEWITAGIKNFEAGSPSSAHIIFEQLRRGKKLELEDVFRSELNLSVQCTMHPDFPEGVRALLVDKDQSPKWQPATLDEITKSWVDGHFSPLWSESEHPLKELGKSESVCQK
jgi:enoyl-CoA hydratase/carnithine racemase